jgi:hypothetical protein
MLCGKLWGFSQQLSAKEEVKQIAYMLSTTAVTPEVSGAMAVVRYDFPARVPLQDAAWVRAPVLPWDRQGYSVTILQGIL